MSRASPNADPGWAWAPYQPDAQRPWTLPLAAHLYRRAGFGARWNELQQALAAGPQATVARLLAPGPRVEELQRKFDELETTAIDPDDSGSATVDAWWLRRLIESSHPLLEKMTLFWHNHFATSNARNGNALRMQRHVQVLRRHALGRFEPLVSELMSDPTLLLWLNATPNFRAKPNENLARALLDLYCLGPGQCSPQDVREAARAMTGWSIERGLYREFEREHDPGVKTLLGQKGEFRTADVVRIALAQPATARWIVRKLYALLISETDEPEPALLAPLAESFARDYDVGRLVGTMLRSNWFFSPAAYRRRVKSPVEYAVGIVRSLESMVPTAPLSNELARLGQSLCHPPTPKGWAGGRSWITDATLIARDNLAVSLLSPTGPYGGKLDPAALSERHGFRDPAAMTRFYFDLLLGADVAPEVRAAISNGERGLLAAGSDASQSARALVHGIVTLPEFHLA